MKRTILCVFAALLAGFTFAQTSDDGLRVWENNVITYQAPVDNIDSITFVSKSAIGESLIGDLITAITPIIEDEVEVGYTMSFLHHEPINIYHGKNGVDGNDGIDGVNGNDGKNGITPLFKIEEEYWWISYDNGESWEKLGKAKGDKGDDKFESVSQDSDSAYFKLTDGTNISIAKHRSFEDEFMQIVADNLVNSFTIDKSTILLRTIGQQETILWETKPFSTSNVEWSSSDENIISVENGVVTANAYGYGTVTAKVGTRTQTCDVYVIDEQEKTFSLSETTKVVFAPGNLQYNAATKEWRFAENPYDVIGPFNMMRSATYNGWIDLFAFGCNGYKYEPYEMGNYFYQPNSQYGNVNLTSGCPDDLSKTNYDWGWYNSISNGGNKTHQWRTMTSSELSYLNGTRENAANLKTPATFNGVSGWLIFPDGFEKPSTLKLTIPATSYTTNNIDSQTWEILDAYGAIFLPATGWFYWANNSVNNQERGMYWTSTFGGGTYQTCCTHYLLTSNAATVKSGGAAESPGVYSGIGFQIYGFAVRLVKDVD